jgi:hypothetical protein
MKLIGARQQLTATSQQHLQHSSNVCACLCVAKGRTLRACVRVSSWTLLCRPKLPSEKASDARQGGTCRQPWRKRLRFRARNPRPCDTPSGLALAPLSRMVRWQVWKGGDECGDVLGEEVCRLGLWRVGCGLFGRTARWTLEGRWIHL